MRRDAAWARDRFLRARVARLATVTPGGTPHLVPVVFALEGDRIVSAVDQKPKSTLRLRRLDNIAAEPRVSLLVDDYDEDWSRLWWARADGRAYAVADHDLSALVAKYPPYRTDPPAGPVVVVDVERWTGWSSGD